MRPILIFKIKLGTTLMFALLSMFFFSVVNAADLGYRYTNGQCVNPNNEVGLNPGFLGPCGDLPGVSLGGLKLENIDLSGSRFDAAALDRISFKNSTLNGTRFTNATLVGVSFENAQLKSTDFTSAEFKNVKFPEASLSQVNFSKAKMREADLSFFECRNCTFSETRLDHANLEAAILYGGDFTKASLRSANLKDADVKDAIFVGAAYNNKTQLPFSKEQANEFKLIYVGIECDSKTEVSYDDKCIYLDGSGGKCLPGYNLAPQSILATIGTSFVGLTYKTTRSFNCCIAHRDQITERQDYGMINGDCNRADGVFVSGPQLGGADCNNALIEGPNQLTLCQSAE